MAAASSSGGDSVRNEWICPEGYEERLKAHYEQAFSHVEKSGATVLFLSHAKRPDKDDTMTGRILNVLSQFGMVDVPLYVAEDVPCDNAGYAAYHPEAEINILRRHLLPYLGLIRSFAKKDKLVLLGLEAVRVNVSKAKDAVPLLTNAMRLPHPSTWTVNEKRQQVYDLLCKVSSTFDMTKEDFDAMVAEAAVTDARLEHNTKQWSDPVTRAVLVEKIRKAQADPATKEKRRLTMADPEYRKAQASTSTAYWEDPENRSAQSKRMKEILNTPEAKTRRQSDEAKKIRCEARKKVYENPEVSKKQTKSIKDHWADPEKKKASLIKGRITRQKNSATRNQSQSLLRQQNSVKEGSR